MVAFHLFLRKISMNFMFGVKGFALATQKLNFSSSGIAVIYLIFLKSQKALRRPQYAAPVPCS